LKVGLTVLYRRTQILGKPNNKLWNGALLGMGENQQDFSIDKEKSPQNQYTKKSKGRRKTVCKWNKYRKKANKAIKMEYHDDAREITTFSFENCDREIIQYL